MSRSYLNSYEFRHEEQRILAQLDRNMASLRKEITMTEDQIKHMVSRFLSWRLPENFSPDAGISFTPTFNENTAHPMRHEPTGTNLLDAEQASAMVRHMVEGLPEGRQP